MCALIALVAVRLSKPHIHGMHEWLALLRQHGPQRVQNVLRGSTLHVRVGIALNALVAVRLIKPHRHVMHTRLARSRSLSDARGIARRASGYVSPSRSHGNLAGREHPCSHRRAGTDLGGEAHQRPRARHVLEARCEHGTAEPTFAETWTSETLILSATAAIWSAGKMRKGHRRRHLVRRR